MKKKILLTVILIAALTALLSACGGLPDASRKSDFNNVYTITYVLDGGTNNTANPSEYKASSGEIILLAPHYYVDGDEGYIFKGWYETDDFSGAKVAKIPAGSIGDRTYYAMWEIAEYTITYRANDGNVDPDSVYNFNCESADIELLPPEKGGSIFLGWFEHDDFSGSIQTVLPAGSTSDRIYFAKWGEARNISYVLNNGTNDASNPSVYCVELENIPLAEPTREGFTFLGWYGNPGFSGDPITFIDTSLDADITLYAKWQAE